MNKPNQSEAKTNFMVRVLTEYSNENGFIIRSTSDLSPLEQYLMNELYRAFHPPFVPAAQSADLTNTNK